MSTDFVLDNLPVPTTKSDKTGVPGGQDPNKWWAAADANKLSAYLGSVRDAIIAGKYHGLAGSSTPYTSPAGAAWMQADAAGNAMVSQDQRPRRRLYWDRDATEFGVVANGATDTASLNANTAACQAALDWAYDQINAHNIAARILWPPGPINYNGTLVVKGTQGGAPALIGAIQGGHTFNQQSSCFTWYGAAGGLMMHTESFNRGVVQDIGFNGRDIAGICLHVDSTQYASPTTLAATSGASFTRCSFKRVQIGTAGAGAVKLGSTTLINTQASELSFVECDFVPEYVAGAGFSANSMQAYGVKMVTGANCKNFSFERCNWNYCNIALDWSSSSGYCIVTRPNMGEIRQAFSQSIDSSGGELTVIGGDIENSSVSDFRLIKSGGANVFTATFIGLEGVVPLSGTVGTMLEYYGQLSLERCNLEELNNKAFVMKVKAFDSADSGGVHVNSKGNYYANCGSASSPYAPFVDSGGNDATNGQNTRFQAWTGVFSQGDAGGPQAAKIAFRNLQGSPPEVPFLKAYVTGFALGDVATLPKYEGQVRRGIVLAQEILYSDIVTKAAGASAVVLRLVAGFKDMRLTDVWARIDTSFSGFASTLTLQVSQFGNNTEDYLAAQSLKQAANTALGTTDATRGHVFTPGDPAYDSKGAHFTDTSMTISARVIGGAALTAGNGLTAGKVTVYLVYDFFG